MTERRLRSVGWLFAPCLLLLLPQSTRSEPPASVRGDAVQHLPRTAQGWSVAQTENFRILHNQPRAFAEQVALAAEKGRALLCDRWLADAADRWTPRCDIWLYATPDEYSRATGVSAQMPGHSTTHGEGQRIIARRIDLRCDHAGLLSAVLPHEITHVVIADRFGEKRVPPWANEGMAVLSEPREQLAKHCGNVPRYWREGRLYSVAQMVRMGDYPPPAEMGSFYAQSVMLVDFLVAQKGPRTFVRFLEDIGYFGYEPALQQHYGWSRAQMEQLWQRRVQQEVGSQALKRSLAAKEFNRP